MATNPGIPEIVDWTPMADDRPNTVRMTVALPYGAIPLPEDHIPIAEVEVTPALVPNEVVGGNSRFEKWLKA